MYQSGLPRAAPHDYHMVPQQYPAPTLHGVLSCLPFGCLPLPWLSHFIIDQSLVFVEPGGKVDLAQGAGVYEGTCTWPFGG